MCLCVHAFFRAQPDEALRSVGEQVEEKEKAITSTTNLLRGQTCSPARGAINSRILLKGLGGVGVTYLYNLPDTLLVI